MMVISFRTITCMVPLKITETSYYLHFFFLTKILYVLEIWKCGEKCSLWNKPENVNLELRFQGKWIEKEQEHLPWKEYRMSKYENQTSTMESQEYVPQKSRWQFLVSSWQYLALFHSEKNSIKFCDKLDVVWHITIRNVFQWMHIIIESL